MINNARNFLSGHLIIKIEGLSLEKLLNAAVSQKVRLWGVSRPNYSELTAHTDIKSFHKLRHISKKHNCRIRILAKRGLPFKTHRFKRRIMIPIGLVLFLLFLYGLSSFIWVVELEGVVNADRQVILESLSDSGIKPGSLKMNLDLRNIENRILNTNPELIWISIELQGSKAIVNIKETTKPPDMIDPLTPHNIVAKRDGVIEKIVVLDGEAMVSAGDTVKKGQLLVSGIIEDKNTGTIRYTHARAQILAHTWYNARATVPINRSEYRETGKKAVHKFLEFGVFKVFLRRDLLDFKLYEVERKSIPFFGKNRFLPVNVEIEEYHEIIEVPILIDDIKNNAKERALNDLHVKIPSDAKIIDKQVKYDMIEDEIIVAAVYAEVLEDIAQYRRIEINRGEVFIVGQPIEGKDLYHRQDG